MFVRLQYSLRGPAIGLSAHPHLLRHTFAVVTLEQLQRGHIASLSHLTSEQRGHYTRIFGDPLDWVRRRLGHRSVVTTQIYLHALAELEMHTRMALVPDEWDDPSELLRARGATTLSSDRRGSDPSRSSFCSRRPGLRTSSTMASRLAHPGIVSLLAARTDALPSFSMANLPLPQWHPALAETFA